MTELNVSTLIPPADHPPASTDLGEPARVSFTRRIAQLTFSRIGAQVGLGWIILIFLLAVFAPLLANSHPLLMRQNGKWSSPLARALTPTDVILVVTFFSWAVLWRLKQIKLARRAWVFVAIVLITTVACILTVKPPLAQVYDIYRAGLRTGEITQAIYVPIHFSPEDHQRDNEEQRLIAPTLAHPMGTTSDSADLASNMIYATRIAISIGFVATSVAVAMGVVMGGLMGYLGGWVDLVGMRIAEIFESIPTLVLLLAFVAIFQSHPEQALYIMMVVIGVLSSFSYAEYVRAEFLSLRNRDFVHAAQAAGLPVWSILFKHMLPNAMSPIIVNASFGVAGAILIETTLSFLGIGLQNEASWGSLLEQALGAGGNVFWWLAVYPGLAIFLTVLSYNLIGEALRDALDPRLNKMA